MRQSGAPSALPIAKMAMCRMARINRECLGLHVSISSSFSRVGGLQQALRHDQREGSLRLTWVGHSGVGNFRQPGCGRVGYLARPPQTARRRATSFD
jgi:hypothetical protein